MRTIEVRTGSRNYPVIVKDGGANQLGKILSKALGVKSVKHWVIISESRFSKNISRISRALRAAYAGARVDRFLVPGGERTKNWAFIGKLHGRLIETRSDRSTVILALGGGALGDAAGFLAGTYMRGIRWVVVPTTLLSQVDSAVGGKTAVNFSTAIGKAKNIVGAFHQPSAVVIDPQFLKTLKKRDRVAGCGEILKYSLIEAQFYSSSPKLLRELAAVSKGELPSEALLEACVLAKSIRVSADERDTSGVREVLNFGHTLGHALEAATGFKSYRHGEAVIWGMQAALHLSVIRGHISQETAGTALDALSAFLVPPIPSAVRRSDIIAQLYKDKKSEGGQVRFVLLKGVGQPVSDRGVTHDDIKEALSRMGVLR